MEIIRFNELLRSCRKISRNPVSTKSEKSNERSLGVRPILGLKMDVPRAECRVFPLFTLSLPRNVTLVGVNAKRVGQTYVFVKRKKIINNSAKTCFKTFILIPYFKEEGKKYSTCTSAGERFLKSKTSSKKYVSENLMPKIFV